VKLYVIYINSINKIREDESFFLSTFED